MGVFAFDSRVEESRKLDSKFKWGSWAEFLAGAHTLANDYGIFIRCRYGVGTVFRRFFGRNVTKGVAAFRR